MSKFAPDLRFCKIALLRIAGGIPDYGERLLTHVDEFTILARSGQPRDLPPFFAKLLLDGQWRWPWLESWRTRFAQLGIEPYLWRHSDHWPKFPLEIDLVAHVAMRWVHDARRWEDMCRVLGYKGWRPGQPFPENHRNYSGWRFSVILGDPEEILQSEFQRFLEGDFGHRPPYFPGDRSMITFQMRTSSNS